MFFSRFGFPQFHLLLSFQCLLHALCDGTMEPSNSQHKEFVESEVASVSSLFFCVVSCFSILCPCRYSQRKAKFRKRTAADQGEAFGFCSQRYVFFQRGCYLVCKHPVAVHVDAKIHSEAAVYSHGRHETKTTQNFDELQLSIVKLQQFFFLKS